MPYLIQGFFFKKQKQLNIGMEDYDEWPNAIIKGGTYQSMFSGVIFCDYRGILVGQMIDSSGKSKLLQIRILPEKLEFFKKYEHRTSLIHYEFRRQNGIWVGRYSGLKVGEGSAKCVTNEVSENFFWPPEQV